MRVATSVRCVKLVCTLLQVLLLASNARQALIVSRAKRHAPSALQGDTLIACKHHVHFALQAPTLPGLGHLHVHPVPRGPFLHRLVKLVRFVPMESTVKPPLQYVLPVV